MAVLGLRWCLDFSAVVASGGYSSWQCEGFSSGWLLSLQSLALGLSGSAAVVPGLWSAGLIVVTQLLWDLWELPRSGTDRCLLHWQADSLALNPQGSPHYGSDLHFPDASDAECLLTNLLAIACLLSSDIYSMLCPFCNWVVCVSDTEFYKFFMYSGY